jgi:eukaryotic-like serine/threonine-protein kinase
MTRDTSEMPDHPIKIAMAEFREAWVSGKQPDLEAFCQSHPECGPELRARIQNFIFTVGGFPEADVGAGGIAGAIEGKDSSSGKILGDYRILEEIGRGGMGVVYKAEQVSLNRNVALKVLPAYLNFSDQAVLKFRREAEAGGRQSHPGIVAVHSVGECGGAHFIAQELVEGGYTLEDWLERHRGEGGLPMGYFREVAKLVSKVADALRHAHTSGVIHRDVKPSNILLTPEGVPKLTDFGLAKVEDALSLSRSGSFAGTPYYMSPEQAGSSQKGIDHRTDIFSLGVTLYEMLTLAKPFEGETSHEVLKKILSQEPRNPRRVNVRVPHDLEVICLKALEKDPQHRYDTMSDFLADIERFLAGEVIHARPAGVLTRTGKWIKRNPTLSVGICTAIGALVVSVFLYLQWRIAETEKARAETEKARSEAFRLVNESTTVLPTNPGLALLLAIEGADRLTGNLANNALIAALAACREKKTIFHDDCVRFAALSPMGDRIVTACEGGSAWIWDAETGEKTASLEGHSLSVNIALFNPKDGERILTASRDMTARIWDATTGEALLCFEEHENDVRHAAFDPTGRRVVTASADMTARVWEATTGEEISVLTGHAWAVNTAVFHPEDNGKVLTSSEDGTARIWDVESGEARIVFDHRAAVLSADFSPDGKEVITVSEDHVVRVWNVLTGDDLALLMPEDKTVLAAFSPDGRRVVSAHQDKRIQIWDVSVAKTVASAKEQMRGIIPLKDEGTSVWQYLIKRRLIELLGHVGTVNSVVFSKNGEQAITASNDGTVRIWDARPEPVPISLAGSRERTHFAFTTDGQKVATVSEDKKTIRVWNTRTGEELFQFEDPAPELWIRFILFTPLDERLVAGFQKNCVRIWNLSTGEPVQGPDHNGDLYDISFSSDGKKGISASGACGGETVKIWEVSTGKDLLNLAHDRGVQTAMFSLDGERVVTGSDDGASYIWDSETGDRLKVLKGDEGKIVSAMFDRKGNNVLTLSETGVACLWDLTTGDRLVLSNGAGEKARSAIFDSVGNRILTISESRAARIWDAATGKEIARVQHGDRINSARFSNKADKLVTASNDRTARIWDVKSGEEVAAIKQAESVLYAAFLPDDRGIITFSMNGAPVVWQVAPLPVARQRRPRTFTAEELERYHIEPHGVAVHRMPRRGGDAYVAENYSLDEKRDNIGVPAPGLHGKPTERPVSVEEIDPFLFVAEKDGEAVLRCFDPLYVNGSRVLQNIEISQPYDIALSNDGKWLCYLDRGQNREVSVMVQEIGKGEAYSICDTNLANTDCPSWHPNNQRIYLMGFEERSSERHTQQNIFQVDVSGGLNQTPRRVLGRPNQLFGCPQISRDGKRICFIHYPGQNWLYYKEVWIADLSSDILSALNPERLTFDEKEDDRCVFSQDGTYVYFFSHVQDGPWYLCRKSLHGSEREVLFKFSSGKKPSGRKQITVSKSGLIGFDVEEDGHLVIKILDSSGRPVYTHSMLGWDVYLPAFVDG